MSRREHLALRLSGVLLLLIVGAWPRSRYSAHDRTVVAAASHATDAPRRARAGMPVVTTTARRDYGEGPRPRAPKDLAVIDGIVEGAPSDDEASTY